MLTWITLSGIIGMAPPGGDQGLGGLFGSMWFPMVLIIVMFYFLLYMPERKRKQERESLLKNLQRGDEILTAGGIKGKITAITDTEVTVEIAKDVRVKIGRQFISSVVGKEDSGKDAKARDKDSDKDKDKGGKK